MYNLVKYLSDTEEKKKIKVSIKPYSPNECIQQNNVDVIKKSIVGLRLSPTANVSIHCITEVCLTKRFTLKRVRMSSLFHMNIYFLSGMTYWKFYE